MEFARLGQMNGRVAMSTSDELLFGAEQARGRDGDGDGVSDAQELIDGTDPNDAADSIRHDVAVVGPSTIDPRGDLEHATLERETTIDVAAANPSGNSLEQSLPTGLDGKPIPTSHDYGNADADKLLSGRDDENSPLDMDRNVTEGGSTAPSAGRDSTRPDGGGVKSTPDGGTWTDGSKESAGHGTTPPPDADLSFRAPNGGLVSDDNLRALIGVAPESAAPKANEDPKTKFLKESGQSNTPSDQQAAWEKKTAPKKYDTGEDGGTVAPTDDQLAHAVVVHDNATDFVEGFGGGPQIEGDAPPERPDLVTDPSPDGDGDSSVDTSTVTVTPPGEFFTDPINPDSGFGPGLGVPPGPGSGDGGGDGRQGSSSAATAAEAPADAPADAPAEVSGLSVVGGGGATGSGIQTIAGDDVTGMGAPGSTDNSGRESQASAMMAGDDDDLEELEVQRADLAPSGSGTQTEDEIYIDVTGTPAATTAAPGAAEAEDSGDIATTEGIIIPDTDRPVMEDSLPMPIDPVAEAMIAHEAPYEAPTDTFSGLEVEDTLAIPAEVDLDDGF